MRRYVVIRDMSKGNAETGEAWQETKIFTGTATLDEVMRWADNSHRRSEKRIQITRPDESEYLNKI